MGCGMEDDKPGFIPSAFGPLTFLVLMSYLFVKRALEYLSTIKDQRAKLGLCQALPDAPSLSTHVTTTNPSLDVSLSVSNFLGSVNISSSLIVDVQPTRVSFEDCVEDQLAFSSIAAFLEIPLSSSPPPATDEFWDAYGIQRVPVTLYQPMTSSPNILLLHETTTCSVDNSPTPTTVSAFMRFMCIIESFVIVSLCGTVAFLLSSIIGFFNYAEPEDIDKVNVSIVLLPSLIFLTTPFLHSSDPTVTSTKLLCPSNLLRSFTISPVQHS